MKHRPFVLAVALGATSCLVPVATAQPKAPLPNVRAKTILVTIKGEIVKPGTYQIKATATLSSLLAVAGGGTRRAGLDEIALQRVGGGYTVDLPRFMSDVEAGRREDLLLRNGDVITVPRGTKKVYILGVVAKPGLYKVPVEKTLSVNDVLTLAGGTKQDDKVVKFEISRRATTGKTTSIFVEGSSLVQNGDFINVSKLPRPKSSTPRFRLLTPYDSR